jgi:hypothetical protein
MDSVTLVHPEETLKVPVLQAINKCRLFQKNLTLAAAPHRIKSSVTLSHFREFVSVLEGKVVDITDTNFTGLQRLCEEFGFLEFAAKLSEFRPSMGFQEAADADARGRIAALEGKAKQHNCDIRFCSPSSGTHHHDRVFCRTLSNPHILDDFPGINVTILSPHQCD